MHAPDEKSSPLDSPSDWAYRAFVFARFLFGVGLLTSRSNGLRGSGSPKTALLFRGLNDILCGVDDMVTGGGESADGRKVAICFTLSSSEFIEFPCRPLSTLLSEPQ